MNHEKYFCQRILKGVDYKFISLGPKGAIPKRIDIRWQVQNLYYLTFGDVNQNDPLPNDFIRTNNNDCRKVLATVAAMAMDFLTINPAAIIVATGSTESRNRLYQWGIASVYHEICDGFELSGSCNGRWEPFRKGVNYQSFMMKRKQGLVFPMPVSMQ